MNRMLVLSVFCAVTIVAARANPLFVCPAIACEPDCPAIKCSEGFQTVRPRCSCCPSCGTFIAVGGSCPLSGMDWQCADGSECLDGICGYSTGGPYVPGSLFPPTV